MTSACCCCVNWTGPELWAPPRLYSTLLYFTLLYFTLSVERPLRNRRGGKRCGSLWLQSGAFTAKNLLPLFISCRHFDPRDTAAWHQPTEGFSLAPHDSCLSERETLHSPCGNTAKSCKRLIPGVIIFILLFFNLKRGLELPAGFTPDILDLFLS